MNDYERKDTLYGTVTACSANGCYVRIDGASQTCPYAYFKGFARPGDRVMLSVIRVFDTQILTGLDSVIEYAA